MAAWQNIKFFRPHPEHTWSLVRNIAVKHYTETEGYVVKMGHNNETAAVSTLVD